MRKVKRRGKRGGMRVSETPLRRCISAVLNSARNDEHRANPDARFQLLHFGERYCPVKVVNAAVRMLESIDDSTGFYSGSDERLSALANEGAAEILRILCFAVWDNRPGAPATKVVARHVRKRAYREGTPRTVTLTRHERNPQARKACIAHYGADCVVCGFSFEETYGEFAREYIHVHHLESLATSEGEHDVDPVKDLRPVCPNCHAMLHLTAPALSVAELKRIVAERGTG